MIKNRTMTTTVNDSGQDSGPGHQHRHAHHHHHGDGHVESGYKIFDKYTTQKAVHTAFFEQHASEFGMDKVKSVLSVGVGSGDMDTGLLLRCWINVTSYSAIEPQTSAINSLQAQLKRMSSDIQSHLFNETVENWFATKKSDEHYDMIALLMALCHIDDTKDTLQKCMGMLNPSGSIIVSFPCLKYFSDLRLKVFNIKEKHFDADAAIKLIEELFGDYCTINQYRVDYIMDIRPPEISNGLSHVVFHREATEEELNKFKSYVSENCPSGIMDCSSYVIHIAKQN